MALCLFDPVKRIGAMNHIFLPGRTDLKQFDAPARFGINAMELLINKMLMLGADRQRFLAKAFGGAHVLPGIASENNPGRKISEFVKTFLINEFIPLTSCSLGEIRGATSYFMRTRVMLMTRKSHRPKSRTSGRGNRKRWANL